MFAVPVFSFIFGILGAGLDIKLGTPYIFQSLGVLVGYIIWIRMRCSAIAKGSMLYDSKTAIYVLVITWCSVFFSGAPKIGLGRGSDITETGFYTWSIVSLLIGAVAVWFHQRETKQQYEDASKPASKKLQIRCPNCNRKLKGATENMAGDIGVCPKCKTEFEIKQQ